MNLSHKHKLIFGVFGIGALFFLVLHFDFASITYGKSSMVQTQKNLKKLKKKKALPVCGPEEGYVCPWKTDVPPISYVSKPSCATPQWKWDTKYQEWKPGNKKECSDKNAICNYFNHEDLPLQNFKAKKWDPLKFGASYTPQYDITRQNVVTKKYNPYAQTLVTCNPDLIGPYFGIPRSNFEASCDYMVPEDEDFWLEKGKVEYRMHQLRWKACRP